MAPTPIAVLGLVDENVQAWKEVFQPDYEVVYHALSPELATNAFGEVIQGVAPEYFSDAEKAQLTSAPKAFVIVSPSYDNNFLFAAWKITTVTNIHIPVLTPDPALLGQAETEGTVLELTPAKDVVERVAKTLKKIAEDPKTEGQEAEQKAWVY
ncbi:hypothetical protein F5Y11DRAFT_12707 [Daldinia sp. FL1419]|nr:hypothetical protein F5Y11DRAFT_12707 [Daldinia sp. FL1419]